MVRLNLPGELGTFVRNEPFDKRRTQFNQMGLNNVLGDFVGSSRQNQALFNKIGLTPSPEQNQQVLGGGVVPETPLAPPVVPPAAGAGAIPVAEAPGAAQGPPVPPPAPAAPPPVQPRFETFTGSPDIFEIGTKRRISPEEAARTSGVFTDVEGQLGPAVIQRTTVRPDIGVEADFARFAGIDIGGQARAVEDATAGVTAATDIMAAIDEDPDVILAREDAARKRGRADDALSRASGRLAAKADIDTASVKRKAEDAIQSLLSKLEAASLAGSGFQITGERDIKAGLEESLTRIREGLSRAQLDEAAKAIAKREDIDFSLAKVVVRAVEAEVRDQIKQQEAEQKAFDDFLRSQGLVINPLTGEAIPTAGELRARESAKRARASAARAAQARAEAHERFLERGLTKQEKAVGTFITDDKVNQLAEVGISQEFAEKITLDILNGVTLEEIREKFRATGVPTTTLDDFDRIVTIKDILESEASKAEGGGVSGRKVD